MARNFSKMKLGYYPLPPSEGENIRKVLLFGDGPTNVIDPCAGTGAALHQITDGANCRKFGVEIDAARALAATESGISTIHGDALEVHSYVEQFSLLYLNPPYDQEIGPMGNQRMESVFLEHTWNWLRVDGVLVFVIPLKRIYACADLLSTRFSNVRAYRLTDPESERFGQGVIFANRRDNKAADFTKRVLRDICNGNVQVPALAPGVLSFQVPPSDSEPRPLTYKGLPLDTIEDLLPTSTAWKQVSSVFLPAEEVSGGRPLTPLHGGHVGLLCTAGLLNGVFGRDDNNTRHVSRWRSTKHTTKTFEEGEDGEQITRIRERFSNDLTLIFSDGRFECRGETATPDEPLTLSDAA